MIVDLMRNDLGRGARPGSVNGARLVRGGKLSKSVHQLVSTVRAQLETRTSPRSIACARLFPAAR